MFTIESTLSTIQFNYIYTIRWINESESDERRWINREEKSYEGKFILNFPSHTLDSRLMPAALAYNTRK